MAYEKTWQFDTNRTYIPANVSPPVILTCVFSAGGGTLSATTYHYAVTAIKNNVESPTSGEFRIDSQAGGTITLTWTAVAGATAYNVYRGSASGTYNRLYVLGNVTTYTDTANTGAPGVVPAAPPYTPGPDMCKYIIWYYKAFVTGQIGGATLGLWTVAGSSDGVSSGMDAVDRWDATYNPAKIITNTAGLAHSWVVLQSPVMAGKTYYVLFDYTGAATYYGFSCSIGAAAPAGGSNTTAPTFSVSGSPISPSLGLNYASSWGPFAVHGALATDGSFHVLVSKNNTRKFISATMVHLLANARAADQYPVMLNNNSGPSDLSSGYGTVTGSSGYGPDTLTQTAMLTQNGGSSDQYAMILPIAGNWPGGEDRFDKTFADYPLWVSKRATGNGFVGVRGRLQDIVLTSGLYASGTGPASFGTAIDDQFAPKYVTIGCFRFPIDVPIGLPSPNLISISSLFGSTSGGTVVVLTGSNFRLGAVVTFGGSVATISNLTPTAITVTTPAHAGGTVTVTVTNSDAQASSLVNSYQYLSLLIPDDAGTIFHFSVQGGVPTNHIGSKILVESGAVPRVGSTAMGFPNGKSAEGAGPFSAADFFSLESGLFNFTDTVWITAVCKSGVNPANHAAILSAFSGTSAANAAGFVAYVSFNPPLNDDFVKYKNGSGGLAFPIISMAQNTIFIHSMGMSAGTSFTKGDQVATTSSAISPTPDMTGFTGTPLIGKGNATTDPSGSTIDPWNGTVFEVRVTRTVPTAALLNALHAAIVNNP